MDDSENNSELLENIPEDNESQYMIQRMTVDNEQLLNSDLLVQHNLVVGLDTGDFIPVSYPTDDLLTQHLTEEDRNLAAALVAVQLSQQQKHQQHHGDQLILTDKSTNGYIQIVGADTLYETYDETRTVKTEDENTFHCTQRDSDGEMKSDNRTSRKSLPHKKRISHKLKKNSSMSRYKLSKCTLCEETFATSEELEEHQQACQTTITPISSLFSCQLCSAGFHDQLSFFEHLKSHYEPIVQVHINESDSVMNDDSIKPILKIEAVDPPKDNLLSSLLNLHCLQCNKIFKRQKAYEAHVRDVHNKVELNEFSEPEDLMAGIDVVVDPNDQQTVEDTKCWTNYRDEELHATEEDLMEIEAQDHVCHICKQPFPIRAILLQHLITCRATNDQTELNGLTKKKSKKKKEEHACTECDRVFTHRNSLVYHTRSHTGDRPHQCEHCGKSFFAASALKVHMRLHSGVKPYKCEACGRFFRQWGDLKYHTISIHSNQKQYQCEYCGKDFARKYSLIVHRRIHTGEKNYKCDYCGKTFRASSYLQNHRRIHTGEKPHTCEVCGKPFRVRSDMKRHMKTHGRRRNVRTVQTSPCDLVIAKIEEAENNDSIIGEGDTDEEIDPHESELRENAIAVQALHFGEDELETVQDSHGNTVYVMPVILT